MPRTSRRPPGTTGYAVVSLVASLVASLLVLAGPAGAAEPCVSKAEFAKIQSGMTIQKLGKVLDEQVPFAQTKGKGNQSYRWYAACDAWQPDLDVVVRYHEAAVGRRTVTKKSLDVYEAAPRR